MKAVSRWIGSWVLLVLPLHGLVADPETSRTPKPEPRQNDQAAALGRISADSMRGHLSFLASDLLEGRGTPSRGLDLASEYIAAQFRRAGLEPAGNDGYFQTAQWKVSRPAPASFALQLQVEGKTLSLQPAQVSLPTPRAFDLSDVETFKLDMQAEAPLAGLTPDAIEGKVILLAAPEEPDALLARRVAQGRARKAFLGRLRRLKPALVINFSRDPGAATGLADGFLIDPEGRIKSRSQPEDGTPAWLTIHDPDALRVFEALPLGPVAARVTLRLGEPAIRPVTLRNVIGVLRGSDPTLKETYVMVSAHYDHLGLSTPVAGDRIYNGANDDGSGTVSVIELASALGSLKERPRRSIVFLTFFGEELGLFGSRYYTEHPVFPIEKTVADVNLELMGRTDGTEGRQVSAASVTGFDFSEVGSILQAAGQVEGVRITRHPVNSDRYFDQSDNRSLAELGVPAHTVSVVYDYADYHEPTDHWEKIDFANMAKVDQAVGRALLAIANSDAAPRWNEENPRAGRYLKAWRVRHEP